MQGEPLRVIESLGHSEKAYAVAKTTLDRKYGGERRLVSLYFDELDNFRPTKDLEKTLEKFTDLMDVAVVNLRQADMLSKLENRTLYIQLQKKLSETMVTNFQ